MPDIIRRRHQTLIPDDPNYDVSADEWNDSLVVIGGVQDGEMMVKNSSVADGWSFASSFTGPVVVGDIVAGHIQGTSLDISGNANIVNATFAGDIVAGHIQGASLDVSGNANISGTSYLLGGVVANNIQATSLDVSGNAQIANATFTGDLAAGHIQGTSLDISGNANISGTSYLLGGVVANNIQAASLDVSGNTQIANATFTGDLVAGHLQGTSLDISGNSNFVGDATFRKLFADTATPSTNNTQVATTAWVNARISAMGGGTVTNAAGALTANQLVLGNGGADIKSLGSSGAATQVLHGNPSGAPTWGLVDIFTQVNGWSTGSWTPNLTASQSTSGVGYTSQKGVYVRTGLLVVAYFDIQLYAKGTHVGAGLFIEGLPFPVGGTGGVFPYSAIVRMGNMTDPATGGRPYIGVSAWSNPTSPSTIALWGQLPYGNPSYPPDIAHATPNAIIQSTDLTDTSTISGTIFYFTN